MADPKRRILLTAASCPKCEYLKSHADLTGIPEVDAYSWEGLLETQYYDLDRDHLELPCLIDGDKIITGAIAIMRHLKGEE